MHRFTFDENNPIDVDGNHGYEYQCEIDAACVAQANLTADLLEVLKVTAGNIRSLGPAGALDVLPAPYLEWLRVVDGAIAKATSSTEQGLAK